MFETIVLRNQGGEFSICGYYDWKGYLLYEYKAKKKKNYLIDSFIQWHDIFCFKFEN